MRKLSDASATLPELMIHLENALDIQERHWRIHWILNLAQFQASLDLHGLLVPSVAHLDDPGRFNVVCFLENLPDTPRSFLPRARRRATVTVEPLALEEVSPPSGA